MLVAMAVMAMVARPADAAKVVIPPGKTECVSAEFAAMHFDVPGGPRVEGVITASSRHAHYVPSVTARLHGPAGDQIWTALVNTDTHFNLAAPGPGVYKICFYSAYESRVDVVVDLVYFTLGHLRRPGIVQVPRGTEESRGKEVASHDHLDGVKRNVMVVSELVEILSGEQRYLARKLERHMKTARSSNRRAFWYTLLEVGIAVGVGCAQIGVVRGWFKGGPTRITV